MKEKILLKLQEMRENEDDSLAALEFAAERSVELMQAYCNVRELPEELLNVGVSLAGMLADNDGLMTAEKAKSIREGDVSVSFADDGEGGTAELMGHFRMELDRYRRMDW